MNLYSKVPYLMACSLLAVSSVTVAPRAFATDYFSYQEQRSRSTIDRFEREEKEWDSADTGYALRMTRRALRSELRHSAKNGDAANYYSHAEEWLEELEEGINVYSSEGEAGRSRVSWLPRLSVSFKGSDPTRPRLEIGEHVEAALDVRNEEVSLTYAAEF